jgi:glycosyltransferase involved in cell wall biosynthesis
MAWRCAPLSLSGAVRELYARAREHDVVVMMEDGPALFSGFTERPKILFSQGHDVIGLPFLVPTYWLGTVLDDVYRARTIGDIARAVAYPGPRLLRWSVLQSRQRRGIRDCKSIVAVPFQRPYVTTLGVLDRTVFLPFMLDVETLAEYDAVHAANTNERFASFATVFFHPTRIFTRPTHDQRYTKDNSKLLKAFYEHSRLYENTILVIVEKGPPDDIAYMKDMVRKLGIGNRVMWIHEMTHVQLRSFYRMSNVVVCDQFNPRIASMGNVGREASYFGRPLVTSLCADLATYFRNDPPPHVVSADSVAAIAEGLARFANLTPSAREELSEQAKAWTERNLTPHALLPRYIEVLRNAVR